MVKKIIWVALVISVSLNANAGNKIKYYFNNPVNNSVSTGVNATYLNSCLADTLVAYINRARFTIDIAQYDYNQGSYANIATAVNNAYTRGVKVRWIYDGSSSNTGLAALNSGIHTLGSPTTSAYTIMHNKFVIIDAHSANTADPIVWTGSADWSTSQFNGDYNNIVILQDSALAGAYTAEFNMMWGDTGIAPNTTTSKFGPYKTNLGMHSFTIEGNQVELYFSPSDGTDSHIQSTISTANTDLYFAMYTFTESTDASMIVTKYNSGVYVAGIDDSYSNSYSPYNMFTSGLACHFKVYNEGAKIYHNKYMIVDPSNTSSDPLVLTGSHNWTTSANSKNDENTLIIHNDTAANIYYQSFSSDFIALGGTLNLAVHGCPSAGMPLDRVGADNVNVFPNPAENGVINISYELSSTQNVSVEIFNIIGQKVATVVNNEIQDMGSHTRKFPVSQQGMYFVKFVIGDGHFEKKFVVGNL